MSKLAIIGDVHAHMSYLEQALAEIDPEEVEGILLVGDLGANLLHARWHGAAFIERWQAYLKSVSQVLERLRAFGLPFVWVPGNHDLKDVPGEGNIDGKSATLGGLVIAGIGGAGPDRFGFPYEWDEAQIRALSLPPCDVILSHTPPKGTALDWVPRAQKHVGSEAIREIALRHKGLLICGHIHESPGAVQLGECLCVNVGGLGQPHGRPRISFLERTPEGDSVSYRDLETGESHLWRREVV